MKTTFDFGCVYFFKSVDDNLLYIGKTYNLKNRFSQHLSDPSEWKKDIYYIEYMVIENEVDRDIIETYCINLHKPTYNKDKVFNDVKPTIQIVLPITQLVLKTDILKTINKRNIVGNFKECCLEYISNVENRDFISQIYPLIKEAYEILGEKKIKALEFVQKDIQNQLAIKKTLVNLESEIVNLLNLKIGQILDKSEIKKTLQNIYNVLKIKKTAKATDLANWYEIKDHSIRVNGTPTVKLQVISCKISQLDSNN